MPDPKVQEPKEPEKEPLAEPVKEPEKEPVKVNPLEVKLEGEGIPEKFQGKTVKEFVEGVKATEAELTKSKQTLTQWDAYFQKLLAGEVQLPTRQGEPRENPLSKVDEDTANAILYAVGMQQAPIMSGIGAILKEYTRSVRPDFDQYEEQATQHYNRFPPEAKVDPNVGWDLAYRLAKANAMGGPTPGPPEPAPSLQDQVKKGPELSEDEAIWCKKMGLTPEEYVKYKVPVEAK